MTSMMNGKSSSPNYNLLLLAISSLLVFSLSINVDMVHCLEDKKLLSLQKLRLNKIKSRDHDPRSCIHLKSRIEKGATIFEMKHREYCMGKSITNPNKRQQKRIIKDNLHVHSLQSHFKNSLLFSSSSSSFSPSDINNNAQIPLTSGLKLETLNYIVTLQLGPQNKTLIVDTGSDLTWVQCTPCKSCYNQPEPLFDPLKSISFQPILCNSSTCQSLQSATGNPGTCSSNSCTYVVNYGDGSYTRGELGLESINLGANQVKDFVFGCGLNNKGLFGGASGLMGLARSDLSLISQTHSLFGGVFSYCLPPIEAGPNSGSLILGRNFEAFKNSTPISYTKMVPNTQLPHFYFLNLTGISVGGVALDFNQETSATSNDYSIGKRVLIDSGTVITRLNPSVYRALKTEFLKQFSGYELAPGFSILNTCFNLSGHQQVSIPAIKFHFEGDGDGYKEAELDVDVSGVFYLVKSDGSQVCLALASLNYEDDIEIIGNYQQKNQRVVYDTNGEGKLGFASEACSFI